MTRITTTVLVMVILLNGTGTIMDVTGLSDDIGIELQTGVSDQLDDVMQTLDGTFSADASVVESFVSLVLSAIGIFEAVVTGVFLAPVMIINLFGGSEVVTAIVTVFFAPMYAIATLEVVSMIVRNRTV